MKKAVLSLLITLLLSITLPAYSSFDSALEKFDQGDYSAAIQQFRALAEIGHKEAQFNLGIMYLEGVGTEKDPVKAYGWIQLADKKAQKEQELVANILQSLDEQRQEEAKAFYEQLDSRYSQEAIKLALEPVFKSIDSNTAFAGSDLQPIKQTRPEYPIEANIKGVEGWVKLSFTLDEEGSPTDIRIVAAYPGDTFVRTSVKALKKWQFEKPQMKQQREQVHKYTLRFELMNSGNKKAREALAEVKQKAEQGDSLAQYYYAKYAPEFSFSRKVNSTEWYYKAAQQGLADAQYELANNLLKGQGCETDKEKAINWLIKSASANLGRSQFKLAKLLLDLDDTERGYFWLDKAIESNDSDIALELAEYLHRLKDDRYPVSLIIEQLKEADLKRIALPIRYYELLAELYYIDGQFELAAESQKKANKEMRRIKTVPEAMQAKLEKYELALEQANNKS